MSNIRENIKAIVDKGLSEKELIRIMEEGGYDNEFSCYSTATIRKEIDAMREERILAISNNPFDGYWVVVREWSPNEAEEIDEENSE